MQVLTARVRQCDTNSECYFCRIEFQGLDGEEKIVFLHSYLDTVTLVIYFQVRMVCSFKEGL